MQIKNFKIIVAVILILSFIVSVNTAYSVLNMRDYKLIRIAFMNGYVAALKLSAAEKEKMENDKALLIKTVKSSAESYIGKVEDINR
jgi:hypothetical protein